MLKPKKLYLLPGSLSARLSLWIVLFVGMLFLATFSLMFYYAREAVQNEAEGKAQDLLDMMEIEVTNTLHEKEVIARQTHWNVEQNLDNPKMLEGYLQEILRNNPEIVGVAAAFEPGYYPKHPDDYMIYYYRNGSQLIRSETFAGESFIHQPWYEVTKNTNKEYWSDPAENYKTNDEPIISFCIPMRDKGRAVGSFAIDISLYWLTEKVQRGRPSADVFGAMATRKGAFVIHPDTAQLRPGAMFRVMDQFPDEKHSSLTYRMLKGETGAMTIEFNGVKSYIAYKPIKDTQWVIDVVCPEEEVLGDYHHLIKLMLAVVILSLLAITAFCYFFIHHEINPLQALECSAKQMTKGDYFAPVSTSGRQDEVGSLTNSFVAMRRSIRKHIDEIDRTREKLDDQNKALSEAHEHIKEADRVKTAFLQNMTDQMDNPVREISFLVSDLKAHYDEMSHEEIVELANQMEAHTDTVTSLLSRMLEVATKGEEKEGGAC